MEGILSRIKSGDLPENAKTAIIQGMMPMDPNDFLFAIYFICSKEPAFLATAKESFSGLPDAVKTQFFNSPTLDSDVLDFFLRSFPIPAESKTAALLNPKINGETLVAISAALESALLQFVVNNQVKVLETPEIIESLRKNPGLSINEAQKLDDYERLFLKNMISTDEELAGKSTEEIEREAIEEAKALVETFGLEKVSRKEMVNAIPKKALNDQEFDDEQPEQEVEGKKISVIKQLARMSVPQKVQAAIKGNREVRNVLIRDANKLVSCAVIKSPRVTDAEIEFYSNMRNIPTEALRLISMNREWMKSYKVVHNLIKNPRTPLGISTKLLGRLNNLDMKSLQRDKGVPEVLRTMARRLFQAKTK